MDDDELVFKDMFRNRLGRRYERALRLFRDYGPHLRWEVAKVLWMAKTRPRQNEVLSALEAFWENDLQRLGTDTRGLIALPDGISANEFFRKIRTEVLGAEA